MQKMFLVTMTTNMCMHVCAFTTAAGLWIRFHSPHPSSQELDPDWIGEDIYLAVVLFGIGGTAICVVGLTLLSLLASWRVHSMFLIGNKNS